MYLVKKRKKHSYLLLELLIGIFLLTLFLTPMLQAPYSYVKRQKKEILSLRLGLEGDRLLIAAEEDLRKGQIPWDSLMESQKEKIFIEKFSFPLSLEKELPSISSRFFLSRGNIKKLENGTWIGTVLATVEFIVPSRPKEVLYKISSTFFVARKKWDHAPSSFPSVKDPICQASL